MRQHWTRRDASSSAAADALVRSLSSVAASGGGKLQLPDLPYDYDALDPVISADIMRIHHTKHHQTYTNNFNQALERLHGTDHPQTLISLQPAIVFNGGGYINHCIFWTNLAPTKQGGGEPPPQGSGLMQALERDLGGLNAFMSTMNTAGAGVQGSGWAWLVFNNNTKRLEVVTRPNQDPVVGAYTPLLGIDMWEHAYYLQYKNDKATYLKNIWQVVNWKNVQERYQAVAG